MTDIFANIFKDRITPFWISFWANSYKRQERRDAFKEKWDQRKNRALQHRVFLLGFFWCLVFPALIVLKVDKTWLQNLLKDFWINEQSVISPIVSLFALFVATFGIFLAGRRNDTTERGQVIERFTRAVEQLGHKEQAVRIGGLHGLEHIAEISLEERSQAFSVLDGFVRSQMANKFSKTFNATLGESRC